MIVAFNYAFLFQEATTDDNLITAMESALQQLMGSEYKVVFVPQDKWPQIRKNYIKEHGLGRRKPATHHQQSQPVPNQQTTQPRPKSTAPAPQSQLAPTAPAPAEEPPLPEEPPVEDDEGGMSPQSGSQSPTDSQDPVAAAKQLFGNDIVKIEDN